MVYNSNYNYIYVYDDADKKILINKVNKDIENLMIAEYAISNDVCIMFNKDNAYDSIRANMVYKKDLFLRLTSANSNGKTYDSETVNKLTTAIRNISKVDEIAAYGNPRVDLYCVNKDNKPSICVEMLFSKCKKKA